MMSSLGRRLVTTVPRLDNDSRMRTQFRVTRWQPGYHVDEVDAFVEAIEEALAPPHRR